jgi:hypothetical protein
MLAVTAAVVEEVAAAKLRDVHAVAAVCGAASTDPFVAPLLNRANSEFTTIVT